jgi:hypothetical protein
MLLAVGSLHVCPTCGVEYCCDEENCEGRPLTDAVICPACCRYPMPHSTWGGHRARRDPVWAAKLARIQARMKMSGGLSQIRPPETLSPCDWTNVGNE